jgi:hypothetical protein
LPDVINFVANHSYIWAVPLDILWKREVVAAHLRANGLRESVARAFEKTLDSWSEAPAPTGADIRDFLEFLIAEPHHRTDFLLLADRSAARYDRLKRNAAVANNPTLPVLLNIAEEAVNWTPAGIHLPKKFSPLEVLSTVGGLAGFPAYQVWQELGLTRLKDTHFNTKRNDILDEWHACYAPYAAACALDGPTFARLRSTKLPCVGKCTQRLEQITRILDAG